MTGGLEAKINEGFVFLLFPLPFTISAQLNIRGYTTTSPCLPTLFTESLLSSETSLTLNS